MQLPFDQDAFFGAFVRYNVTLWPAQIGLLVAALLAIALVRRGVAHTHGVASILALLWLWMAVAYHALVFSRVTPAAWLFGALFFAEGILLVFAGVVRRRLVFEMPTASLRRVAGGALLVYSLALYPLVGVVAGQMFPAMPTFGLPCPTTIFTLGLLLWTRGTPPWWLLVIPLLWAIIGTTAAVQLDVVEDYGLPVSALITCVVLLADAHRDRSTRHTHPLHDQRVGHTA